MHSLRSRRLSSPAIVAVTKGLLLAELVAVVATCGGPGPTARPSTADTMAPTPWASVGPSATPNATPTPSPTPTPTPAPVSFPVAVVVRYDDPRESLSADALTAAASGGKLVAPCEMTGLSLSGQPLALAAGTACLPAADITARIHTEANTIGLLPPGLVSPSVKVLRVGDADLFGSPTHRAIAYPLMAETATAETWTAYDVNDVRTLISTGDTCPDRGVSLMAVTNKKGWDWTLNGGSARYGGFRMDTEYTGPQGTGWPVPNLRRVGNSGTVAALISDNDVSANDFECPMVANWVQHNGGKLFSIDPRVAQTLATKGGLKVVTLGSNHITDAGYAGVRSTIAYLDAAGIKHTGAGATLAAALAPAVVDVRGVKFAFVGWDDIHGSAAATSAHPGAAPMTDANVCDSIKAAKQVADVVIAMPQWGWPEYHSTITKEQIAQRSLFYSCGADGVLGSGTHWASWASILPGSNGPTFAIGSHGNFLFDQNWSQQTMEGVVVEVTFVGTQVAQFRLHPYVVVQGAQPNLLDPRTDGKYVLDRVWSVSDIR